MKKLNLMLITLLLLSCVENPKQENLAKNTFDNFVSISSIDKDGNELKLQFDNNNGTVSLYFLGESFKLTQQKSASGIWYKNDMYELRGKGNDFELKKGEKVIFNHEDEIVRISLKNEEGQTLDMSFNNTTNQVKIYLDGGEQIELEGQNQAPSSWFKNDTYQLRRDGEYFELSKDGKSLFKN